MPIIIMFLLLTMSSGLGASAPIKYTLLHKEAGRVIGSFRQGGCVVSVDQCLDEQELKEIVCEVISNEKLSDQTALIVGVYYRLTEYNPVMESDIFDLPTAGSKRGVRSPKRRAIGFYSWTSDTGVRSRSTLMVVRDQNCESGPARDRKVEFDHTVHCRKVHKQ